MKEFPICKFCQNTGVHFAPYVVQPVLIRCTHKECPITKLDDKCAKLKQLILLTDDAVSDVEMNELSAKQWAEFIKEFPEETE